MPEDFDLFVRRLLGKQSQPALDHSRDRPQGDVGMEGRTPYPEGNFALRADVITQVCREARLSDAGWPAQQGCSA